MVDSEQADVRRVLLAFVETHWRELTLRDARSLCVELFESQSLSFLTIKESLTFR